MITTEHAFIGGRQVDSQGREFFYDDGTLSQIVEVYDTAVHEAPVSWGHSGDTRRSPLDTLPAAGWVRKISKKGNNIYAEIDWSAAGEKEIKDKNYKKFSASFYKPDSPHNPQPGKWSLRHIALLGAEPPAVKGISEMSFSEGEILGVDFIEMGTKKTSPLRYNPLAKNYTSKREDDLRLDDKKGLYYYTENRKRHYVLDYIDKDGLRKRMDPESGGYLPNDYIDYYKKSDGRYAYVDSSGTEQPINNFRSKLNNSFEFDSEASKYCSKDESGFKTYMDGDPDDDIFLEDPETSATSHSECAYCGKEEEEEELLESPLLALEEKIRQIEMDNERLKLAADLASKNLQRKELLDFLGTIYSDGRLTEGIMPKAVLADYMEAIDAGNYVQFSESGTTPTGVLKTLLERLPKVVNYSSTEKTNGSDVDFSETNVLDPDRQAKELVKTNKFSSYEEAIKYVLYGRVS